MFINYRSEHRFTSDELGLIALFADQAAVAIHSAQLYQRLQTRADTLQVLYDAGQQVTSSMELEHVLKVVAEQTARLTGVNGQQAGYCSVILTDVSGRTPAAVFPNERLNDYLTFWRSRESNYPHRSGITGWVMEHGETYLTGDVSNDPHYIPFDPLTLSELTVPIKLGGKTIGVINAEHPERSIFDEQDKQAIESLAALVANTVRNAQGHFEATVLQEVSAELAGALEVEQVLTLVLNAACKLTNTPISKMLFWDEEQQRFEPSYKTNDSGQAIVRYQTSARPDGYTRQILESREAVIVPDTWNSPYVSEAMLKQPRRAYIAVRVENDSKAIGVLFVFNSEPRQFSEHQLTLLKTLTHAFAAAINRAKQHEELKKTHKELKETKGLVGRRTAVAWMGMASSIWRHGIEGDAYAIRNEVSNLRDELSGEMYTSEIHQRLQHIEENVSNILNRPITPPLSEEDGMQSVPLNDFLRERLKQRWEDGKNTLIAYRFELLSDERLTVWANVHWLRQIIDHLIDNAIKAMSDTEQKLLIVSTCQKGKEVTIRFTDTGCGVPEDVVHNLLQEPVRSSTGLGMGLLMADTIAQTYGGKIELIHPGPHCTTFTVRFPIEQATQD
jgi:GAF domain-containing protein